ncbi:hypothetical protein [Leucobacter japonicus]|uniref:hypothetical protein n=1 Tax=Leucobacter japonicus TaxID=1461259 RepID=UPI0006A77787|nr:hypothetical protein [Leucobacter japonicus]
MIRKIRRWRIPEPKHISIIMGIAYIVFVLTGFATLVTPPRSIVGQFGEVTMLLVGVFFVLGGSVGMLAGALEWWELERFAVVTMGMGLATYAYIVTTLHFTTEGSRLTQLGVITIATCLLALRGAMIWRYDFKPRG